MYACTYIHAFMCLFVCKSVHRYIPTHIAVLLHTSIYIHFCKRGLRPRKDLTSYKYCLLFLVIAAKYRWITDLERFWNSLISHTKFLNHSLDFANAILTYTYNHTNCYYRLRYKWQTFRKFKTHIQARIYTYYSVYYIYAYIQISAHVCMRLRTYYGVVMNVFMP